jgi:hypothetical protein
MEDVKQLSLHELVPNPRRNDEEARNYGLAAECHMGSPEATSRTQ